MEEQKALIVAEAVIQQDVKLESVEEKQKFVNDVLRYSTNIALERQRMSEMVVPRGGERDYIEKTK